MKILVTGGCGFIGSNLLIYLKKKGFSVYSLDNFFRNGSRLNLKRLKKYNIKNYNIDISNNKKVEKLKTKFDLILDCCAEPSVSKSIKEIDRVLYTNLIGTFNILKKCVRDKSKLIFLSSSRVYSLKLLRRINSNKNIKNKIKSKNTYNIFSSTSGPKSLYGFTKFASEELIEEFSYSNNLKYIINRLGVVAGPWQFGKVDQGFMSLWVWKHMLKQNLNYIGYGGFGNQVRDVLHIEDLCYLIFLQIKKIDTINNIKFTAGGGINNSISLKELTGICEKITKNKIKIKKIKKTNMYDVPYYVSSNKLISEKYSWKPKKDVKTIIEDIFNWQSKNLINLKKVIN